MSVLPSQVNRLQTRVEIAPGADQSANPATWAWVDITNRVTSESRTALLDQVMSIRQGRGDEFGQVQPATVSFECDNPDGALTPDNPLSPWWPAWDVGTPARVSILGGSPQLAVTGAAGARARTPDHTSLDVTDLFAAVEVVFPAWPLPSGTTKIMGRYQGTQRSWQLLLVDNGTFGLLWSTDGLASGEAGAVSSVPIRPSIGGRIAFGVHLDVAAGGSHVATFYAARSLDELLADPEAAVVDFDIFPGNTSIFPGSSPLDIGDVDGSGYTRPYMTMRAAVVRNGTPTSGPLVADPDFTAQQSGATSFQDSTGKTWTVNPPAAISNARTRLVGQVDEITPTWPHGDLSTDEHPGEARVDITVSGILRRLTQGAKALRSSLYRLATAPFNIDSVLAYWPMEDGRDSGSAASAIPGAPAMDVGGEVQFATDDTLAGSDSLPTVSGGQPFGWNGRVPSSPTTQWAVDLYVRMPTGLADPASTVVAVIGSSGTVKRWRIAFNTTQGSVRGYAADGTEIVTNFFANSGVIFGTWAQIRFEAEQQGGVVSWEMFWVPLDTGVVFSVFAGIVGTLGAVTGVYNLETAPPDGLSVGHIVVTTGMPVEWLNPADKGWAGEPAGRRIERLCDEEGVPILIQGDPADTEPMGVQRPLALPDLLEECAAADLGILCEQRGHLGLAYRTRRSMFNQPVALQLDAAKNAIDNPFEPTKDDQRRRNDVTVAREGGSSYRVVDPDVETRKKPRYDEEVTLNVARDDQLQAQAGWRYAFGTWPRMRIPTVTTELTAATDLDDLIDQWLDLVLGDRVQVLNPPPQHPERTIELLAEGWSESISPARWTPQLNCSPGGPWIVGQLDSSGPPDPALARLDSDASTLAAGIDEDDLSWTVAVADEALWTTSVTYFPLRVLIGGEEITVSAISGASSPQTFTASQRAVNGIRKAHPAGTSVHVADPFRLAF